tara:strand:- start:39 stop:1334 length:1296 start_codon:yes stop_codon:yes gene_type:complete
MKKNLVRFAIFFSIFFCNPSFAETYYFKGCKLSNVATGDYIINLDKKTVQATLKATDGRTQTLYDKIKTVDKFQIITEKIESGKGNNVFFEYYLNSKSKKVIKLEYIKQSGLDIDIFKILSKKESKCSDVKGGWDKDKIEKAKIDKEKEQILKAQEKLKKEQSGENKCIGNNYKQWTNCKGSFKADSGHKYDGIFKNGSIVKGIALYPGGAKYVGEFKNFKPHGYGNFAWENGDKYFGEWKNGKIEGSGTKIWKSGEEYSGTFKNEKPHGDGTFYYNDGKKYVGGFLNGKRHGDGTITYRDGTAFIGKFLSGKQEGSGECVALDGSTIPCENKDAIKVQDFSGKDTRKISIVAKKWVRISQYENNTKRGKKIMDKLKTDFEAQALELCSSKGKYNVLQKRIEILDSDDTPAYGLETKLKLGISGVVECIKS